MSRRPKRRNRAGGRGFENAQPNKLQADERKPTDWLIRGFLVRDTLAGLIGQPGAYKSFLAVDWACRVATGTDPEAAAGGVH